MSQSEQNRSQKAAPSPRHPAAGISVSRRALMIGLAATVGGGAVAWTMLRPSPSLGRAAVTVWKSPECGCCGGWVSYMRGHGYEVTVNDVEDTGHLKEVLGIPEDLQSCHTSRVEGYLVEGHVPEAAVAKLLKERPDIKGLALPGMPVGAPGMDGKSGTYEVLAFGKDGRRRPFMTAGV